MVLWRWAASSSRCSLIDTASSIASKRNPLGLNRGTKDHHLLQVSAARRELNMTATQRIFSVQQDCLHDSLHDTCKWGATPAYGSGPTDTGMRRLTLDYNDSEARTWFVEETKRLGCTKHVVDELGNIFAIRPGKDDGPPTAMGSHLDTQPGPGGRYDGILGIHAGVEALRVLQENSIETEFPICVVNWANEEGVRFPCSVMASSIWADLISLEEAWNLKEVPFLAVSAKGQPLKSVKEELQRTRWLGETKCNHSQMPLGAHFELHIEQGPVLERQGKKIGVVTGGQAYRWFTVTIRGRDAHTGTTPMENRSDALQASAQIIVASREIAKSLGGLCTTGLLKLQPGSINTIPGAVEFSLDIRHSQNKGVVAIQEALEKEANRIASKEGNCNFKWTTDTDSKVVNFHTDCIQAIKESAQEAVGADKWIEMKSGAGHDSFATSTRCPTSMIFVPSKDGISHNEREFTSKADCASGAQVLLGAVLRYDQMRKAGLNRGYHTVSLQRSISRSFSTSSRRREDKIKQDKPTKPRDTRAFAKRYPPVAPLPEPVNFDQPAVSNPIETAEAHVRFRKQARWAIQILAGSALMGAILYWGVGVGHADEGNRDAVSEDVVQGKRLEVQKRYNIAHEEMEKRIMEAQKDLNHGSYAVLAVKRSTTIAKAVALCVWDYRKTLNNKYPNKAEEQEGLRQCHLRSAHRVLEALRENGGLYIKLGQHISSVILLPVEWTDTMKPLQDQNTPTPLSELATMFQAETGFTFDEAFSEIDPKPIGVASLAQVHRAVDRKTGKSLAIKLMHPEVERFSEVDMRTVNVLVKWIKRAFPQFECTWLAEEMNQNLPLEMDFRHEAQNSERAAKDFQNYKKTTIYIPKVPWVYKRVMAMEFIDGRRPDDLEYLAKHNIDRNRVSQELSRIFAQMLYLHGFFHADPHGGNVLIRPAPKESRSSFNFEVVLLDHGLYFDIDQELRTNYARFWLSLLSKSSSKIKTERRRLAKQIANIDDDLYPILESAITGRSGLEGSDDKNPNGVKGSKRKSSLLDLDKGVGMSSDEQEHIRKTVMQKEGLFLDILQVLRMVPRRMLMVLKLNDLTRSLDASLHTTHGLARPFVITARYCALAVWRDDKSKLSNKYHKQGLSFSLLGDYISCFFSYLWFNKGLSFFETLSDFNATRRRIFSFSAAFAKCFNVSNARRASSGVEIQAQKQAKQLQDRQRAKEEVDYELRQYQTAK